MAVPLIRFVCIAEKHFSAPGQGSTTVHESEWAYCFSAQLDGHDWQRRDLPVDVSDLRAERLVHRRPTITIVSTPNEVAKDKSKNRRG